MSLVLVLLKPPLMEGLCVLLKPVEGQAGSYVIASVVPSSH